MENNTPKIDGVRKLVLNVQNEFGLFPDGRWGTWGAYGACSVTCGSGNQTRTRLCNAPPPSLGGLPCPGSDSTTQTCNTATTCIVSKYFDSIELDLQCGS